MTITATTSKMCFMNKASELRRKVHKTNNELRGVFRKSLKNQRCGAVIRRL